MQLKKPKTGLAWWVAALISLSLALLASATLYMSDVLLTRSAGWPQLLSLLKTNRSWVFVGVTALLLCGLIGNLLAKGYELPQTDKLSDTARTESIPPVPSLWQDAHTPLLIFLLLASAVGGMSYPIYAHQRHTLQKAIAGGLSAIADKKVVAIRHWLAERRSNAEFIARDSFIAGAVGRWLSAQTPAEEDSQLLETWLTNLRETFDYSAVMLLDANGQVRLGLGASKIHPYRQALAQQAMASGQVIMSDFHWRQEVVGGPIDLDLIIPVGRGLAGENQAIGALVLKIDPEQYLFPLIQIWPTASPSAETLLVRREGDEVVYLNELRHRQGTALQLRLPLASKQLPAARAIQGESGVLEGLDYRQVPVLSVARPIPETPWFLIAKIDTEEVYAPLRILMQLVTIAASILIMIAGAGTMLWWRQQHASFVANLYRRELERQALVRHFDYLAKYANDIILLMDSQGQVIEANDRAVAAYGYPYKELLGLNIRDLHTPESHALIAERISQATRLDGLIFETVHQRKDGTCFPIEVSSRRIDIQGQIFLQSIIRDITERKQAEEHLHYQLRLVQSIADQAAESIFVTDTQGCVTFLNAEAERTFGFRAGEFTGQRLHDKLHHHYPDGRPFPVRECPMAQVYTVGKAIQNHEDVFFRKDGLPVAVECSNAPLESNGKRIGTVLMVRNITERKRAEKALHESERRYRSLFENMLEGYAYCRVLFEQETPQDFIYLEVNSAFEKLTGLTDVVGKKVSEVIPGIQEANPALFQIYGRVALTGKPERFEMYLDALGIWFSIAVYSPKKEYFAAVFDNITARKRTEEALRREQSLLDSVMRTTDVMLVLLDSQFNFVWVNPAYAETCRLKPEEVIGKNHFALYPHAENEAIFRKVRDTGEGVFYKDKPFVFPNQPERGVTYWDWSLTPVKDAGGRVTGLVFSLRETTEFKQAEEALRESEERFRLAMDATNDGLWEWDIPTGRTYYSPAYFRMLGYELGEFANTCHTWVDLLHPDDREHALAVNQDCIENCRETFQVEFRMRAKNGEWRWILGRGKAVTRDTSGRALLLVGTHVDITERKQTEEALAENIRFINQVLDTSPNLIWVKDAQGRFLLANQAVADLTGKTKEELLHQPCLEVYPNPEEVSEYLQVDREVIRTGRVIAQEESCTKPNGEVMWVYTTKAPLRQTDGTVSVLGIAVDITKRKQAEEALRASTAQLAWAQRLAHLGSWESDLIARREYWSDETYRILGYEPRAFEPLCDCLLSHVHPDDRERISSTVARALNREAPYDITFRILRPGGEEGVLQSQGEVIFDENGQAVAIKGAIQDITERRHIERQLREQERQLIQADKLAALGTLVSGIAHEINNPNNLILLNAELLAKACADLVIIVDHCQGETEDWLVAGLPYAEMCETLPTLIQDIHQGALRIQKIVADLKDFVRPSAITSGADFNLNEPIQHALKLLSHAIKKRTDHLQVDLAEDLPLLLGNAQQLEQVVVNLIMNALEALPDKTHGLSLATDLKLEDNCIELRVADEGIGIAPENLNRICEPFFTTKQHQQGTGLGLFIAYKLITAHHGTLSFQSEPGRGTVALVRLPLPAKLPTR